MNWLAHVFLSEPDTEFRLGNLLADCVPRAEWAEMPERFRLGMRRHQVIDAFTDTHPVVKRSRSRLTGNYRHTRGIIIDVLYDHFLALHWGRFCPQSLESFTREFYSAVRESPVPLPSEARDAMEYISRGNRLASYRTPEGVRLALRRLSARLSQRFNKPMPLERAADELVHHFQGFEGDFLAFFPQLQMRVACA